MASVEGGGCFEQVLPGFSLVIACPRLHRRVSYPKCSDDEDGSGVEEGVRKKKGSEAKGKGTRLVREG